MILRTFLLSVSLLWPHLAQATSEPNYLKAISATTAVKIRQLMPRRESSLTTREGLIEHAVRLLLTMQAYLDTAQNIAESAAWQAARTVGGDPAGDIALDSATEAVYYGATCAANRAVRQAVDDGDWDPASGSAADAAYNTTRDAAGGPAWTSAYGAALLAAARCREGDAIGKLAYRSAEKASLVYFAQHARHLIKAAYVASSGYTLSYSAKKIFASPKTWQAFKNKHFGELSPAQIGCLAAWLVELDWIVLRIAAMQS